jgi:hypothetical protein
MSLRKFLTDHHVEAAKHYARLTACEKAKASSHDALAKTLPEGAQKDHHMQMCAACEKAASHHSREADRHVAAAQEVSTMDMGEGIPTGDTHGPAKVAIGDPDNRFAKDTDGVVGIRPPDPERLRAIPRFGSPTPEDLEKDTAEANLQKLPAFARRTA